MKWIFWQECANLINMIAELEGTIKYKRKNYVVIDVGGVGYQVFMTDFALEEISKKERIDLHIFTYVREDTLSLYGFLKFSEKEMFELLISISGIGPKAALGILSIAEPKTIQTAILNNDVSILTRVSGVGKKTAERVILELKNKINEIPIEDRKEAITDSEAIEALQAMGYSLSEAREVLQNIPKETKDVGERIKLALKELGKNRRN